MSNQHELKVVGMKSKQDTIEMAMEKLTKKIIELEFLESMLKKTREQLKVKENKVREQKRKLVKL